MFEQNSSNGKMKIARRVTQESLREARDWFTRHLIVGGSVGLN
jgi:hypothetical protein